MYQFKFADIGEGLHEGKVAEIYKKVNDQVQEGQPLFSVETDKVTADIPSPVTGKVTKVLMEPGAIIHVGDLIYEFAIDQKDAPLPPTTKVSEGGASVVGEVKVSNELFNLNNVQSNAAISQVSSLDKPREGKQGATTKIQDHILTTPLARAMASERGIDLKLVKGSGFNQRVLVQDILNFKAQVRVEGKQGSQFIHKPILKSDQVVSIPLTQMRKAIAKAMTNSWSHVAYTNLVIEVNATKLWNERKKFNEQHNLKVSFTAFIIRATVLALQEFPAVNAKYDETNAAIIQSGTINLGVAVDTKDGLVVPNIPHAELLNLVQISESLSNLATKARDKKLTLKEMSNGTFTITNYGTVGALFGVPVINYPEIAILGTGAIVDRVFVGDNCSFYAGKILNLTCAADHRWLDGAEIGRFMARIKELLENPTWLF